MFTLCKNRFSLITSSIYAKTAGLRHYQLTFKSRSLCDDSTYSHNFWKELSLWWTFTSANFLI